jgi:hypothetical protein
VTVLPQSAAGTLNFVTHPLSARLVLLAAAACLALSLVWAMVAAEMRDVDAPRAQDRGAAQVRGVDGEASAVRVAVR